MKTKSKLLMTLSDLHVGSTVGLWPSDFVSNEGNPIGQNKFQKWLWSCWSDMQGWAKEVIGNDDFDLVINGDIVDGIHHKTLQVMTPDLGDQTSAVKRILGDLAINAANLHLIKGTESHTTTQEIHVGRALGASKDPITGQNAWDNLDLTVHGTLYNFAHHISATARTYLEASAHSIMLGNMTHARARTGKPIPKVMVRAHRHRHGIWEDGNQISAICGAWQGLTRYGYKVVPDAIPQPSVIIFDHRGLKPNELPRIHRKVYTAQ
jgi:hypothetical protein